MSAHPQPTAGPLTAEEYLRRERAAETRSEFSGGEIVAMSGATEAHNLVTLGIAAALRAELRGRPCRVYMADMRVKVSARGAYRYPDVAALCGEPRFEDERRDTLLNPALLVEVLSESTERVDRGEKFAEYRRLESLQEYLLVSQARPWVERYERHGDVWVLSEAMGLDAEVVLSSVGCTLALRDVYGGVDLEAPTPDAPPPGAAPPAP